MKKIVYLLLITILIRYKDTLSNPFRPGVDNPYIINKKPLSDAELAQQLQNEEYEKADTEKLNRKINNLNKLLEKYKKNYRDFVEPKESIKKFQKNENIKTINMQDELISITNCLIGKNNSEKNIKRQIRKCPKYLKKLNKNQKEIILTAYSILHCYNILNNSLPPRSIAKQINPGAQGTFDAIFQHKLIKDGQLKEEAEIILYFFTKEHVGELEALTEEIKILLI